MYEDVQELHIPNKFGCEKMAMEKVASVAKEIGFSNSRIEDLKTAVSEACLNAMEHGAKMNSTTKVGISLSIDKTTLKVSIEDKGKGATGKAEEPDIDKKIAGDQTPRGWGLFLIKRLIDDVKFEPNTDGNSMTTMIIHLDKDRKS